jgi:hypothetical protein
MWDYLLWIALIPQLIVLVVAVRLYRSSRSRPVAFLMWACICLVIARTSWFTFGFFPGFFSPHGAPAQRKLLWHWSEHIDVTFQLAAFIFLAVALLFLSRSPKDHGTPIV